MKKSNLFGFWQRHQARGCLAFGISGSGRGRPAPTKTDFEAFAAWFALQELAMSPPTAPEGPAHLTKGKNE